MSYITLAWVPYKNGQYASSPKEMTLADWGITKCTRETQNMGQDNVGFDISTNVNTSEIFGFGDQITIWVGRIGTSLAGGNQPTSFSGGTKFFVGYRMKNVRSASGRMQSFQYKFSGPWGFFMERHVFQKQWPVYISATGQATLQAKSQIVLGLSASVIQLTKNVSTNRMTVSQQLIEILNFTIQQTINQFHTQLFAFDPSIAFGNLSGSFGNWNGYVPLDAANDLTCAEALKKTLRLIPAISIWFDYTQTIPVIKIATRDTLPSTTLQWGGANSLYPNNTSKIERRDDIIPPCVDYKYRVTTTTNGQNYVTVIDDLACAAGSTNPNTGVTDPALMPYSEYFGAEVATFDFSGGDQTTVVLNTIPVPWNPATNPDDFATWTQTLASALSDQTVYNTSITPGTSVTLSASGGGEADPRYQYILIGGPGTSAITDRNNPNLQQGVQLTLGCTFTYSTRQLSSDGKTWVPIKTNVTERKTVSVYAYSLAGGVFTATNSTPEAIPFGLSAFVYNIEIIPQYEGSHGIVEKDQNTGFPTITNPCGIGTNLNLSGGLVEWQTMRAQVQTVSYDLMSGHTEINFGVASHLGGAEMIERLRINRGPRWFNLISSSPNVNYSGAISGPTQLKDTQGAAEASGMEYSPSTQTPVPPPAGSGLLGGVYKDSGQSTTQFTSPVPATIGKSFQQGAGHVIAQGPTGTTPGESNSWIRISLSDLPVAINGSGGLNIYARELQSQEVINGVCTTGYRLVLCSQFYPISIRGGTPDP